LVFLIQHCGSEVFIAEKVDGGGEDKESGDTITVEKEIRLGGCFECP